jgi:hypothetical protein
MEPDEHQQLRIVGPLPAGHAIARPSTDCGKLLDEIIRELAHFESLRRELIRRLEESKPGPTHP